MHASDLSGLLLQTWGEGGRGNRHRRRGWGQCPCMYGLSLMQLRFWGEARGCLQATNGTHRRGTAT